MTELHGLKIYSKGELAVVTFEAKGYLGSQTFIGQATEHLDRVIEENQSKVLVIDLADITGLPSDMLGMLVRFHHRGLKVRLYNITDDVRMILDTTQLDQLFEIRDGVLSTLIDAATEE